jgi:hypothetical protein
MTTMNTCKKCYEPIHGNYCSNCGCPVQLKRIDKRYLIHEMASAFYAEKGILYTIRKMVVCPGKSIRQYITEDRSLYVKPITFVIITALIYTLVNHFFHIEIKDYQPQAYNKVELPTLDLFLNWMTDYHGYYALLSGLFMAIWVKLFFRKHHYNFFEIFVLLCYTMGIWSLFHSIILIFIELTHFNIFQISIIIPLSYFTLAIGQFFDKKKVGSYLKAFIAFALGMLTMGIIISFVAIFFDIIMAP